jgi:hypothetical protein
MGNKLKSAIGMAAQASVFGVCPFADAVSRRISERAAMGKEKYGVTCERTDLELKEWLTHLQEELMDAAVYIERAKYDLWRATEDSLPITQDHEPS